MSRTRACAPKPKPGKTVIGGTVAIMPQGTDAMTDKFTYEGMPMASISYRIMWPADKRSGPKRTREK